MIAQLELEYAATSRTGEADPELSRQAAQEMTLRVLSCARRFRTFTAREVAEHMNTDVGTVSRRFTTLRRIGWIAQTGERRRGAVYRVTEAAP